MEKEYSNKKISLSYILSFLTIFIFLFSQGVRSGEIGAFAQKIDDLKIKYLFLFFSIIMFLITLCGSKQSTVLFPGGKFRFEFNCYIKAITILAIVTIIFQLIYGFKSFAISEIMYLITPVLFVAFLVSVDSYHITKLINSLFYAVIFVFFLENISILNLETIKSINFMESYSPFESGISNLIIFFEVYFLVRNKKKKAFLCFFISFITLKRISVIIGFLLLILWPVFLKVAKNEKYKKNTIKISIIIFILLPFLLIYFYSPKNANTLYEMTGIEFNKLTMDRYDRTAFILENREEIKYGLGSTTEYLTKYYGNIKMENRNLHCDILRIYLEGTFISTIFVTYFYFKSTSKNFFSIVVMLTLFTDLIFNHTYLGGGNAGLWCIIYMLIFYFNNMKELKFY